VYSVRVQPEVDVAEVAEAGDEERGVVAAVEVEEEAAEVSSSLPN